MSSQQSDYTRHVSFKSQNLAWFVLHSQLRRLKATRRTHLFRQHVYLLLSTPTRSTNAYSES